MAKKEMRKDTMTGEAVNEDAEDADATNEEVEIDGIEKTVIATVATEAAVAAVEVEEVVAVEAVDARGAKTIMSTKTKVAMMNSNQRDARRKKKT